MSDAGVSRSEGSRSNPQADGQPRKPARRQVGLHDAGRARRRLSVWRVLLVLFAGTVVLGVVAFAALYIALDIPEPEDIALAQKTTVYAKDGRTEIGTFGQYDRNPVALEDISEDFQHAVVASEDRSFYTNNGIDLKGITRALWNNVRGKPLQGGSTLTQQYVERYYLGQTTSLRGKVREAVLALKIDRAQPKNQILENYLNTIYYGRGAYGIEAAARKYFGVSADRLTLAQSAMLAGIIPAPSAWDPAVDPDMARVRFDRVLNLMKTDGYITAEERQAQVFPQTIDYVPGEDWSGPNGHVMAAIANELVDAGVATYDELGQMGLKVVSTIDASMQEAAAAAVAELPEDRPENNHVGLISMDPSNGEVRALYGGADYAARQQNAVIQDHAQAGSTFKVFALAAAIDQGVSLNKGLTGAASKDFSGVRITNSQGIGYGTVSLLNATRSSVNTAYVQLNEQIGPQATVDAAIAAGIPKDTPGLEANLTNVLGSAAPTAWDMARAYGTFASGGLRREPHLVRIATNASGKAIYKGDTSGTRVFDEKVAQRVTYALSFVTRSGGSGATAARLGRASAGKTGTSEGPWSSWFCGYIPQLVTVVDMYQVGPNGEMQKIDSFGKYANQPIYGGTYPVEIWTSYMKAATADMEVQPFDYSTLQR